MIGSVKADLPLVGYSAGNFGKNLLLSTTDITLVFVLTDLLGVAPDSVATIMLVAFLGDLIFDFGAGYLTAWSSEHGFGYRRMIAVAAFPCAAAFALLYALPVLRLRNMALLVATLLVFRATYAIVDVPHNSLLARVATDSRARGRTSGYRSFFSTLASLAIATIVAPAVAKSHEMAGSRYLAEIGLCAGCLFCIALWTAAWSSGESSSTQSNRSPNHLSLLPKLDGPMLGMFVIALATGFAMPMFSRMVLYLTTYVLHAPALASRMLLAITIGQFPGVILWIYLMRFAEKTQLLAISYIIVLIGIALFTCAGSQPEILIAATIVIGIGSSGVYMIPWGLLADIIDVAEFKHRQRRETAAFASMLVILKGSAVAGSGTIALVLGALDYRAGAEQSAAVRFGMEGLALGLPLLGGVAALLVLRRMTISHSRHARIRRVLSGRRMRA